MTGTILKCVWASALVIEIERKSDRQEREREREIDNEWEVI